MYSLCTALRYSGTVQKNGMEHFLHTCIEILSRYVPHKKKCIRSNQRIYINKTTVKATMEYSKDRQKFPGTGNVSDKETKNVSHC